MTKRLNNSAPLIFARVPAEWETQRCLWVGWPTFPHLWQDDTDGARRETTAFIKAVSDYVPVKLACGSDEAAKIAADMLEGTAEIIRVPLGDIWLRDTGPIIAETDSQQLGLTFSFNGWGGKYQLPGDTETAAAILAAEHIPERRSEFILEGGAIDHNGAGIILTTKQCLLNPNRNKGWTQAIAETALRDAFHAERIIWLGDGLYGDHTDGHVDNIARFAAPNLVVCQEPSGNNDPNEEVLRDIERILRRENFDVATIPSPGLYADEEGVPVPASHMNFLIANKGIIFPVYDDRNAGRAETALKNIFPQHDIIGLPADHILTGGGSFHCMSQHIPAFSGAKK